MKPFNLFQCHYRIVLLLLIQIVVFNIICNHQHVILLYGFSFVITNNNKNNFRMLHHDNNNHKITIRKSINLPMINSNILHGGTSSSSNVVFLKDNNRFHNIHHKTATCLYVDNGGSSSASFQSSQSAYDNNNNDEISLNELHTKLRDAVQIEDYIEAARISDMMLLRMTSSTTNTASLSNDEKKLLRYQMSWRGLGAAPWLIDRLDTMQYTFPTVIQINAMQAVNAILNDHYQSNKEETTTTAKNQASMLLSSLDERSNSNNKLLDMGIVISGSTGSGKTLAYLVPLLSILSDSLFLRQRLRISDEEAVGDTAGDLADRISIVTSPRINSPTSTTSRYKVGNTIAFGASMGRSGTNVQNPLALIVIPTRELGVQTARLLYQLIGGQIKDSLLTNRLLTSSEIIANALNYKGPKGIRIGCVLDDDEAEFGLKLQTDIAITTPKYLSKLIEENDINTSLLRVIVYDEADLGLELSNPTDLYSLFTSTTREYTRLSFLVGASVTQSLGNLAVTSNILPPGKSYIATSKHYTPLIQTDQQQQQQQQQQETQSNNNDASNMNNNNNITSIELASSFQDLNTCLYPGLKHQRVIIKNGTSGLLVLTRLIRQELKDYEEKYMNNNNNENNNNQYFNDMNNDDDDLDDDLDVLIPKSKNSMNGKQINNNNRQRPRVVIFFPNEVQAKNAIEPLRDALWGEHRLCVLLPTIGVNPLTMMEQFKNNDTTVMLATPNSVRGLDFPLLTHVYTLYLPMNDPREYIHLAGRVGRVGQYGISSGIGGNVISILKEGNDAKQMDSLSQLLNFTFLDMIPPENTIRLRVRDDDDDDEDIYEEEADNLIEIEKMRRLLEDTISLMDDTSVDDNSSEETIKSEINKDENIVQTKDDETHDSFQ